MREKVTHPATPRELIKALKIPQEERATFRRLLKSLVATGELVQTKGGRVGLPDKMDLVVGRLQMNAAGFGFVIPDKAGGDAPDVYVSAANIKEAMHGDRVLARIERRTAENRLEGRIIRILERGNSTIVGRFDIGRLRPGLRAAVRPAHRDRCARAVRPVGRGGARRDGRGGNHDLADRSARARREGRRSAR